MRECLCLKFDPLIGRNQENKTGAVNKQQSCIYIYIYRTLNKVPM